MKTISQQPQSQKHPVQVPRWPSDIALGIKTKFKKFSEEI